MVLRISISVVGDGKNTLISNDPHARKSFKQVQLTLFQASI
jgi:hypothetical protein